MSRYSLRATPRKKELFEGMVETPRHRRRKSQFPTESDNTADDSSAAETPEPTSHASSTSTSTAAASASTSTRHRPSNLGPEPDDVHDADTDMDMDVDTDTDADVATTSTGIMATAAATSKANGETRRRAGSTRVDAPSLSSSAAFLDAKSPHSASAPLLSPNTTTRLMAVDGYVPGQDSRIDYSGEYEFGGPWGTGAMMIGFPVLMWYMWIGATFYNGLPPLPAEGQSWVDFAGHLVRLVYEGAFPSLRALSIYWGFFLFEAVCYCTLPGVWAYGKPLLHENGHQLKYYCNGYASLYVTAVVVGTLHYTGIFKTYELIDEFGPVLTVSIISGYAVSAICFVSAHLRGATHRMTGNLVYDFFMGAELNPRIGIFDLKMFLEVRFDWYVLFMLACGTAARQYETYGYVSGEAAFLVLAHYLYANACSKGEELIVTTWDMYHEKGGFMYIFWTMSGVPFSYCHAIIYLANNHPSAYRWNPIALGALFVVYLFWYWVWDTCNSQKNRFRAAEKGKLVLRKAFPQLPWQTVHNPRTLTTPDGYTILVDGWYGLARKIHYAAEIIFALSWGLVCGFQSPFPWFYPIFFTCMITHRALRDLRKCRIKYGETWAEYERQVPYLFVPYVI